MNFIENLGQIVDVNQQRRSDVLFVGDGGGMTRGLMMASCSGIQMARNL